MKRWMMAGAAAMLLGCATGDDGSSQTTQMTGSTSCPYHVYRHDPQGWLLTTPLVHFVFWGQYWLQEGGYQEQTDYQQSWDSLFSDGQVFQRLAEYGIQPGFLDANSYNTNLNLTTPTDGGVSSDGGSLLELDDSGIPLELNNEIQAGLLPEPTHQTLYVVFLPYNTSTVNLITGDDAGYHASAMYGSTQYAYAVIGYYQDNYNTGDMIVSHEMYEAMTDPDVSTGYYGTDGEHEVADLCVWQPTSFDGYQVQKVWSQDICQCE